MGWNDFAKTLVAALVLGVSCSVHASRANQPYNALQALIAEARRAGVSNSVEVVSGRIEMWARKKSIVFERVRLIKRGPQWIASTRNTLGESRTFQLPLDARAKVLRGRTDNLVVGIPDEEVLTLVQSLGRGNFGSIRELAVDAVSGAPARAVALRLVSRGRDTLELEVLTSTPTPAK